MPDKSNRSKPVDREHDAFWPIMQRAAGLPDDGTEEYQRALEQLKAAMGRMVDARQQMERRSGPLYELSVSRSGLISDAYRSAGSPRCPRGPFIGFSGTGKKLYGPPDHNTPEWLAWRTWVRQRERIRRQHGMQRGKPRI